MSLLDLARRFCPKAGSAVGGSTIEGLGIGGLSVGGSTIGGLGIEGLSVGGLTIEGLAVEDLTVGGLVVDFEGKATRGSRAKGSHVESLGREFGGLVFEDVDGEAVT